VHHGEFNDARLVEVYDVLCPWSREDDLFVSLVNERPRARVLDLGCGTGRLTLALAAAGHTVTGVDPALASLGVARMKAGADAVTWVHGTASALPIATFDVAVMTSHVAQFFVGDDEWSETLDDLKRALVPGASLYFESRDPAAREWERWNPVDSRRRSVLADGRVVISWTQVTDLIGGAVSFTHHYEFPAETHLTATATLRFRTEDELRTSLDRAGFAIEAIYGGWERQAIGAGDGEFIVSARSR
jgi:ubiquinone/menaquinone biosynthesis C-methylase UbiE